MTQLGHMETSDKLATNYLVMQGNIKVEGQLPFLMLSLQANFHT